MIATTSHSTVEVGIARVPMAKVLLVGALLLMAAARALLVPLNDSDWDATMTAMVQNRGRSDAGWLLAIAASGLPAITAVMLASRLHNAGRTRSAAFVSVTTAVGWAATAALCLGGLHLSVAADAPDRAAQVALQKDFNEAIAHVFEMIAVAAIGYVVLAVGLARRASPPRARPSSSGSAASPRCSPWEVLSLRFSSLPRCC